MPELPEVETTVRQIKKAARGLTVRDVWTDYGSPLHNSKRNIKDAAFFELFRNAVVGKKIIDTSRRGKHVLIHLSGGLTVLVHMKMSGHFLYGKYKRIDRTWLPDEKKESFHDPYNRFIHLVFTFSNGKHLAFSDLRKFATVTFFKDKEKELIPDLSKIGPEPLDTHFSFKHFQDRLSLKPAGKIKTVLMDQTVLAGVGNIYSDEILFAAGVHPEERAMDVQKPRIKKMYDAMRKILAYSISIGGDSESDFRDLDGKRGGFQNKHKAYHQTGKKCSKPGCDGTIIRHIVGGRSAHFCDRHQQLNRVKKAVS